MLILYQYKCLRGRTIQCCHAHSRVLEWCVKFGIWRWSHVYKLEGLFVEWVAFGWYCGKNISVVACTPPTCHSPSSYTSQIYAPWYSTCLVAILLLQTHTVYPSATSNPYGSVCVCWWLRTNIWLRSCMVSGECCNDVAIVGQPVERKKI